MNKNSMQNFSILRPTKQLSLVAALIFIYIIMFEFVLLPIRYIPKPSLLLDSFISLLDSYNLAALLFSTTSVIYIALLSGSLLVTLLAKYLLKIIYEYPGMMNINIPFKYFSIFFFALLFNIWFGESLIAEFLFAILSVLSILLSVLNKESKILSEEHILTAKSLGLNGHELYEKVIWKELQPRIFNKLNNIHVSLWMIILIYEFISQTEGVGSLYFSAYSYNDIGAIFALGIFISLLILIGNLIIKFLFRKIYFWE